MSRFNKSKDRYKKTIIEQKGRCAYCGISLMNIPVHMDHIIPFSYTGHSSNDNWVLSCSKCNQQKSDKIFRDTSDVADFCYKMILDHGSLGEGWPEGSWDYWEFAPIEEDDMVGSPKGGAGTSNDG